MDKNIKIGDLYSTFCFAFYELYMHVFVFSFFIPLCNVNVTISIT